MAKYGVVVGLACIYLFTSIYPSWVDHESRSGGELGNRRGWGGRTGGLDLFFIFYGSWGIKNYLENKGLDSPGSNMGGGGRGACFIGGNWGQANTKPKKPSFVRSRGLVLNLPRYV